MPYSIVHSVDSDKAKVLENSKDIRKEITKSDNLRNIVKLVYKLPLGEIAFHFKSKKPMPVVKLEFECPEDLDKAMKTEIIILAEGKKRNCP